MLFRDELEDAPCAKYKRALDKLLTGYDAPLLQCMYLDKPMRDHLLQKRVGLVTDFVGVLRELKEALQFDRADVSGVIEDLGLLLKDFLDEIVKARAARLEAGEGSADEKLETVVGRLFDPEAGKAFYEAYRDIEALWEIPSPSRNCATISKAIRALCSGAQRLRAAGRLCRRPRLQDTAPRRGGNEPGRSRYPDQDRYLRLENRRSDSGHSFR